MRSPDNFHRLVYYDLNEIPMAGPIGGECYLETKDHNKIKIHDWCGGPPVWETVGRMVAIPIWVRYPREGLVQHIGVVDVIKKELRIYSKTFSVVDLRSFDGEVIYGLVSSAKGMGDLVFDVGKEKILKTVRLVE